jgi:predicted aconitase
MDLTKAEEAILDGNSSQTLQKAMELLVALGEMKDATHLIPVSSVQVSGVSYKTIGNAGLEFLRDWASGGATSKVLATLNPMGVDLDTWEDFGFPEEFVTKQKDIISAYEKMGITTSCTCTPYLAGNEPGFGENIAWAESSSTIFANSVIGARTNRESGPSALASALLGKTPYCGLHLDENRQPTFSVEVDLDLMDTRDYAALGFHIGQNYRGIPLIKGIKDPSMEDLKVMGAAMATGPISMYHIEGLTPEAQGCEVPEEGVTFGKAEFKETLDILNTADDVDIVCIGCPHCSLKEVIEVLDMDPKVETWVYTTKQNKALLENKVKNKNVKIISDTCMVVSPLEEVGIRSLGTNSAKCAFYSQNLSRLETRFDTLENLIR